MILIHSTHEAEFKMGGIGAVLDGLLSVPSYLSQVITRMVVSKGLWRTMEQFNVAARASRVVLINQFGFSRDRCGDTMPADMQFDDLRQGSDLEFGQSTYEPFGIAQMEPLPSGALCAVSDVCGCVGFAERQLRQISDFTLRQRASKDAGGPGADQGFTLRQRAGKDAGGPGNHKRPYRNILVAGYPTLAIGEAKRDTVVHNTAHEVAQAILDRLPRSDADKATLMADGYLLAQHMSWEVVARAQLLPTITS